MNITISEAYPRDYDEACGLIQEGLRDHWGDGFDPTFNADLNNIAAAYGQEIFLIARDEDGKIVGTGAVICEDACTGRVVRMSVARNLRRQGIGWKILNALLDASRKRGYSKLVLETTSTWTDAVSFYLNFGFSIIGTENGDTHFVINL
jgi:GNAT superfamily N-acetyltransferase